MKQEDKVFIATLSVFLIFFFVAIIKFKPDLNESFEQKKERNITKLHNETEYNFSFINKPEKELPFNVIRKIVVNGTKFCIFEKNIKRCEDIKKYKRFSGFDYNINMSYTVVFELHNNQVIIINPSRQERPEILFYRVGSGYD